jgi:hypothetical protein
MYGEPVTPLRLVAWLGAGIGKGLRQFWEELRELTRVMRREFVRSFEAEQESTESSAKQKILSAPSASYWVPSDRVDSVPLMRAFNPVTFGI